MSVSSMAERASRGNCLGAARRGVSGVLVLWSRCRMVSCVIVCARLRVLYAGEVGGVDTLESGGVVCFGGTLGGCGGDHGTGCGMVTVSSSLSLESLS